jgi:predicted hotdog family 3-hydroxylacyl-ACP dehydratase
MMEETLEHIDVLDLLPQRPPFVMIDHLIHYDPVITRTRFTIRKDNLFYQPDGRYEEAGLIETIAQSCAARMGYIESLKKNSSIKLGFVGMIKKMSILRAPHLGEVLDTTINVVAEIFQTTLVEAKIEIAGEVIATCEMKIFLSDIERQK